MTDIENIVCVLDTFKALGMIQDYTIEEKYAAIREITLVGINKEVENQEMFIRVKLAINAFDEANIDNYVLRVRRGKEC